MTSWAKELGAILKLDVELVFANPDDIKRYLGEFYNLARSMKRASEAQPGQVSLARNFEQLVELGKRGTLDANDSHVVHITDWLWQYAFEQRASDIHIEPRRDVGQVRFRIDGVLHQVYAIPTPVLLAMTSRIKLLARMEIVEKRRPQDGRIKTVAPDGQEVELRIATMPTAFGEKIVMRIFTPEVLVRDFTDLGFTPDDRARWEQMVREPHGIILVTGPTGSGKTTTLYTALDELNKPDVKILTVEDPVEYQMAGINQIQVKPQIDLTFANALRSIVRQDPDVIMIGEIRDLETAQIAVQSALTGHLVLSTVHTNDAAGTVNRLLDMGVEDYLLTSTVIGIEAQRLVRTLCPHCKEPYTALPEMVEHTGIGRFAGGGPVTLWHAKGCGQCSHTGYTGRVSIIEMMPMTDALRALVMRHATSIELKAQAVRDGMVTMYEDGLRKAVTGITTVEEVLRATRED